MCPLEALGVDERELERRATAVLERVPGFIWDGESVPIPIEDIVDSCYGLLVRDVEDMTRAPVPGGLAADAWISGLLLAARGEIWVNAEDARRWPPRRRFTIGHELGHWELHRTGQETLFCRAGHVEPAGEEGGETVGAGAAAGGKFGGDGDATAGSAARGPLAAVTAARPPKPPPEEEADVFAAALLMPAHLVERHRADCGDDVAELCRRFHCSEKAMRRRLASVAPHAVGS